MKRPDSSTISIIVCFFIIVVLSFSLIFVLGERGTAEAVDVSPLQDLAQTIRSEYYFYDDKKLDSEKLVNSAMRGMITSLDDPYAQYYTEEEYKQLLTENSGDYVGIGISVQVPDESGSMVISVYEGGPADLAGLKKGDIITQINGTPTANLSLDALIACFSNDEEKPDEIIYLRDGVETTISVKRTEVHIKRVDSSVLSNNIGYIRITEFNGSVASDFIAAAKALQDQGVRNLIIDLRDNPGGGLNEVLSVANTLIPKDSVIVSIRSKSGDERVYKSEGGEQFNMKLVVLVNGYSASASELLTGALKDYGLATIVGTQTFGKGIVQSFFHISENGGWAKMTTDAYFTPNDVCIQGVGISPDLVVELPEELKDTSIDLIEPAQDTQLKAAIGVFAQQASLPKAIAR
ncbi:putative CtpA-like serine protease [bioreactor metagenome]|uniref:Putative CtpA-like serine protease n=1 Tax=bioreactor metagenome TaxID=1076179 RepID=A0A644YMI0_9ZZZZ|nr:S41 family peptidase [Christensenella sp.]